MSIITDLGRECIEYHCHAIIDRDDSDIEFEWFQKENVRVVSIIDGSGK